MDLGSVTPLRKVLGNAAWAYASLPVGVLSGMAQIALLARLLGPEGVGKLGLFLAVAATLAGILRLNTAETVLVFVTRSLRQTGVHGTSCLVRALYLLEIVSGLAAFSACFALQRLVCSAFHISVSDSAAFSIYALTLITGATYWASHAILRVTERFELTFVQSLVSAAFKTTLVGMAYVWHFKLSCVCAIMVLSSLCDSLLIGMLARRSWNCHAIERPDHGRDATVWPKEIFAFQLHGHARQLFKSAARNADLMLLGLLASPAEVGIYRAARQIGDQIQNPIQAFMASLFPEYSRLHAAGEMDRLRDLWKKSSSLSAVAAGLLIVASFCFSGVIVRIFLGPAFQSGVGVLSVVLVASAIAVWMAPVQALPTAVGQNRPALVAVILGFVGQMASLLILVPKYGAKGAAVGAVVFMLIWGGILAKVSFRIAAEAGPKNENEGSHIRITK